jgi:hypothetical protein
LFFLLFNPDQRGLPLKKKEATYVPLLLSPSFPFSVCRKVEEIKRKEKGD